MFEILTNKQFREKYGGREDLEDLEIMNSARELLRSFYQQNPEFTYLSATLDYVCISYEWDYTLSTIFKVTVANSTEKSVRASWEQHGCSCNSYCDDHWPDKPEYDPDLIKWDSKWYLLEPNESLVDAAIRTENAQEAVKILQSQLEQEITRCGELTRNICDLSSELNQTKRQLKESQSYSCLLL